MNTLKDLKNKGILANAFYEKVAQVGDCWEWQGTLNTSGYGVLRFSYDSYLAHRVSYELAYNEITKGWMVCHKCDNKKCVNPLHLFLGTAKDNNHDMMRKGRHNCFGLYKKKLVKPTHHKKTHCHNGHEFTPENSAFYGKTRRCKICHRANSKNYSDKVKQVRAT